jgi:putative nucleotidyltransferase with HDIG domain
MNHLLVDQAESLGTRILELVEAEEVQLPPLPEIALKAQEILSSEMAETRELDRLLSQDPGIAAALLRLANSTAFGARGTVESLSVAIQRIGLRQVGAMVTGLSVKTQFQNGAGVKRQLLEILWDHSVTSAFAARTIAKEIGLDPEAAFLAGLLHDCGMVLVLAGVAHVEKEDGQPSAERDSLVALMEELHGELGYKVLNSWNLPEEIAYVALHHEDEAVHDDDLLLTVKASDLITKKLGFHLDPDEETSLVEHPVMENLGLDDLAVATLMVDMEDHLLEMRALF